MSVAVCESFDAGSHPLSDEADQLLDKFQNDKLIGKEWIQGELLFAAWDIANDWYENYWGETNWSDCVNYIKNHFQDLPNQPPPDILTKLYDTLDTVHKYSHGEPHDVSGQAELWVVTIQEIVVRAVIDNPNLIPNKANREDYLEDESPVHDWPVLEIKNVGDLMKRLSKFDPKLPLFVRLDSKLELELNLGVQVSRMPREEGGKDYVIIDVNSEKTFKSSNIEDEDEENEEDN